MKQDIMEHLEYNENKSCRKRERYLFELAVRRAIKQQKRHDYALRNGYKYVRTKTRIEDTENKKRKIFKKKQKTQYSKENLG